MTCSQKHASSDDIATVNADADIVERVLDVFTKIRDKS